MKAEELLGKFQGIEGYKSGLTLGRVNTLLPQPDPIQKWMIPNYWVKRGIMSISV